MYKYWKDKFCACLIFFGFLYIYSHGSTRQIISFLRCSNNLTTHKWCVISMDAFISTLIISIILRLIIFLNINKVFAYDSLRAMAKPILNRSIKIFSSSIIDLQFVERIQFICGIIVLQSINPMRQHEKIILVRILMPCSSSGFHSVNAYLLLSLSQVSTIHWKWYDPELWFNIFPYSTLFQSWNFIIQITWTNLMWYTHYPKRDWFVCMCACDNYGNQPEDGRVLDDNRILSGASFDSFITATAALRSRIVARLTTDT